MNRALTLTLLLAAASPAAARSQIGVVPGPQEVATPALMFARIASAFDARFVPQDMVDRLVRWQMGIRDLAHGAVDSLTTLATDIGSRIPDLTVLTTDPLPASRSKGPASGFGWRDDPMNHHAKYHQGADIRANHGTPVVAAGDGVVVFAGRQGGYGNVIYVDHGGGVLTRYAHLQKIEIKKDMACVAGQRIGQVGSTGRATGPHLHFEVRLDGRAVNPTTALAVAQLEREVPEAGHLAAFALAPEVQAHEQSGIDPPRQRVRGKKPAGSRPERAGHTKRVRSVS